MNFDKDLLVIGQAYELSGNDLHVLQDDSVARLVVSGNRVVTFNELPGIHMRAEQLGNGVKVWLEVDPGTVVEQPIHLCFGVVPAEGEQVIISEFDIGDGAQVEFLAHCSFPNAIKVRHLMDAQIRVGANASMNYSEVHYHGRQGGVYTRPLTRATVGPGGRFISQFKMIEGKVGELEIDFEAELGAGAVGELTAKAYGKGDDKIKAREVIYLRGAEARGLTKTNVVVIDQAESDIYTEMHGLAPQSRGHMDCTEVVGGHAIAKNTPVVLVTEQTAKVTHEAAIGSVDRKQVETLMSRGLSEDDAVDIVVEGLLR